MADNVSLISMWSMSLESIALICAITLGVYGSILSTYNIILEIRRRRPRLKVTICVGEMIEGQGLSERRLMVIAQNKSHEEAKLGMVGILPDKKKTLMMPEVGGKKFPFNLSPWGTYTTWIDPERFAKILIREGFSGELKLIGYYRDGVGNMYKSKSMKFNIDEFSKIEVEKCK